MSAAAAAVAAAAAFYGLYMEVVDVETGCPHSHKHLLWNFSRGFTSEAESSEASQTHQNVFFLVSFLV